MASCKRNGRACIRTLNGQATCFSALGLVGDGDSVLSGLAVYSIMDGTEDSVTILT